MYSTISISADYRMFHRAASKSSIGPLEPGWSQCPLSTSFSLHFTASGKEAEGRSYEDDIASWDKVSSSLPSILVARGTEVLVDDRLGEGPMRTPIIMLLGHAEKCHHDYTLVQHLISQNVFGKFPITLVGLLAVTLSA